MSEQEAIKTLKNNVCRQCTSGYSCMEECSIGYCDNREAVQTLMMAMDARKEKGKITVRDYAAILGNIQTAATNKLFLQPAPENILDNATKIYMKQMELMAGTEVEE